MRNQLRIIGGVHKGRKIQFKQGQDLRPTGERLRETVFNWLQNDIDDADCLDAFAGSGILGIEALSRGAKSVIFCERSRVVAQTLRNNLDSVFKHNDSTHNVLTGDCLKQLPKLDQSFDVIFLDPPFQHASYTLNCCLDLIQQQALLNKGGCIYVEIPQKTTIEALHNHSHWLIHKQTRSGYVIAYLLTQQA